MKALIKEGQPLRREFRQWRKTIAENNVEWGTTRYRTTAAVHPGDGRGGREARAEGQGIGQMDGHGPHRASDVRPRQQTGPGQNVLTERGASKDLDGLRRVEEADGPDENGRGAARQGRGARHRTEGARHRSGEWEADTRSHPPPFGRERDMMGHDG